MPTETGNTSSQAPVAALLASGKVQHRHSGLAQEMLSAKEEVVSLAF